METLADLSLLPAAREEKHPAQSGCRSRSTPRKNNASASMINAMAWPTRFGRPRRAPPPLFLN